MKKEEKYINFFGDTQNYQFDRPVPNPYNLRGNPDEFDWGMNEGGDGLNGQPSHTPTPYASFDGDEDFYDDVYDINDDYANHPGFIDAWFKKDPAKQVDLSDGNTYAWSEIQSDENLMNLYTADQNLKKSNRKEWWGNFWSKLGTGVSTLPDKFASGVQAGSGVYQQPTVIQPIQPIQPAPNTTPTQAGMDTTKIIGWVLVGGVVITGLIMAANMGKQNQQPIIVKA